MLDDDRVHTLVNFSYPIDYVKYTILENEANYAVTAYYLLGTDQNYWEAIGAEPDIGGPPYITRYW